MKTYIGNDRCTRCGGGSSPCPVCNPIEEQPMKQIPYFESDGSYNEREYKRPAPRDNFWLAFDDSLSKQLKGKVSPEDGEWLDQMNEARKVLLGAGCLPGNRGYAVEKQIVMKAQVFMRKFAKSLT